MTQQEAEVILKINDQQSRDKLDQLEAKAKSLRQQFADAFKKGDVRGVNDINRELQRTNREMNNLRTNAANIRAAMVRMSDATPRELRRTIKMINDELNSGRVRRGSKEWDSYIEKLHEVQAELRKVNAEMEGDDGGSFFDRIKDSINDWGATAAAAMGAFAGVVMSGKAAVQTYADMQAEEANVRKFTGMTADEVARLNAEFRKMDTRTSREDLNRLAQEAGRLGKTSVTDVMGFVNAADQINVALDDLGEGATLTLSKLTGIFGDEAVYGTEKSLLKVGSVINELSQNCSASSPYLAEFSSRIGGIAAQSKMTISQVMAFAAVLDTQNLAVEASSTAVGQLITSIYQEPAKIARAAGMDVKKFSEMVKTDMNGALIMLFEQLNKFGGMEQLAGVFDSMGTDGARAIPVLTAPAGHIEELKWQQGEANKAFQEGTSVSKEFEVQNTTVQAQLDKARKGFTEMAVSLGEQLVPAMSYCISGTSMLMRVMGVLVTFIREHIKALTLLTVAIVAYNVAAKASVLWTKAHTAALTAGQTVMKSVAALQTLLTAGLALLTGNITKATAAWRLFNLAFKSNPIGLIVSAVASGIAALTMWISKNKEAAAEEKRLAEERRREREEFKKGISEIGEAAASYASGELQRLKKLYDAATNEYKSKEKRIAAAKELQKTYPNTFSNLTTEAILAGNAAEAYMQLARNIREVARAEAAKDKIKANESRRINLDMSNEDVDDQLREKERQLDALDKRISGLRTAARGSAEKAKELKAAKEAYNSIADEIDRLDRMKAENNDRIAEIDKTNARLQKVAENTVRNMENINLRGGVESPGATLAAPASESDRKAREKAAKEAEKEREKQQREAREALKKDLDERKSLYLQAEAENLSLYTLGKKNYLDYCNDREELEKEYVDDVVKIHEKHDKLDIAAYGSALKRKADMQQKHLEAERARSIKDLDRTRGADENEAVADYYDPNGSLYQNKKALNQRLLDIEVAYLQQVAALYADGSKERIEAEERLADVLAKDQLEKQKETAEAYAAFEERYRQASGSQREKMQLDMLGELHRQGLISEEEYQRAVNDIRQESMDKDVERARTVESEYGDMVWNLYTTFSKFFSELGQEGTNFWENLAGAAQAAFAVMGAAMSQYSAYSSASQDLELAKIEKRYDKEIEAAGKNTKKREKLEKQKEADIAKVKKKYNDRAMKIELAQAIAQTAVNALGAYGSMVKIPVVGPALAAAAAAMAVAAGMIQVATIKKQHEAQAAGYYEGGFTPRDPSNRREVGVVHANEFVANHEAVANPALAPVLRLIDHAQRTNTVGSLTAADVSHAIGRSSGVGPGGDTYRTDAADAFAGSFALMADMTSRAGAAIDRLSENLEGGILAEVILDGERGLHKRYRDYQKMIDNPKR